VRDGEFSPMSVGRARIHGEIGLTRAANSYATGFQMCIPDSTGTNSAWAANPGSDGDPRRDVGFQTKPKGRKIYSILPIHNIVFTIKYLKLYLARHICISHNTYRVILFTSLPYSIIRKN